MAENENDFRDVEPVIPEDLSKSTLDQILEWKSALDRITIAIQAQLADRQATLRASGRMDSLEYRELCVWQGRAKKKMAALQVKQSRLRDEIRRRESQRGAEDTARKKDQLYPALQDLAVAIASWKEAPAHVKEAASELTVVLSRFTR